MTSNDNEFVNINRLRLYAVYDSQVQAYLRPFTAPSDGDAVRAFADQCGANNQDSVFAQHAGDFTLYFVAEFHEASAHIDNVENIRLISGLEALQYLQAEALKRAAALERAHNQSDPDRDPNTADLFPEQE